MPVAPLRNFLLVTPVILVLAWALPLVPASAATTNLDVITRAADNNDPGAELLLGLAYLEGRYNLQSDPDKAGFWLRRAARSGQPYAQRIWGDMHATGKGASKDTERAVYWWRQAANSGDNVARQELGQAYLEGRGVRKDSNSAIAWLRKSAEQGNAEAQYLLGKLYIDGHDVPVDKELAHSWLSQAAAQGHSDAMRLLELVVDVGEKAMATYEESADALEQRAAKGDPRAEYELALRYESGAWDVKHDDKQALHWMSLAAQHGNRHAMSALSHVYGEGALGVPANAEKAAYWNTKAKAAGD